MWVYIFLTFFTARYVDSKLVTDKRYIFWLYLKSSLIPDILANIPLFLINYNFLWLKLLWIFRLSNVTDLISNSDWINKKILPYFIVD